MLGSLMMTSQRQTLEEVGSGSRLDDYGDISDLSRYVAANCQMCQSRFCVMMRFESRQTEAVVMSIVS